MDDLKAEAAADVRAVDALMEGSMKPLPLRRLWFKPTSELAEGTSEPAKPATAATANLVSSLTEEGTHRPCLDIDHTVAVVHSSTPGHYHIYFDDIELSWRQYKRLLAALADAGIISMGYYRNSIRCGGTFLRRPGVMKTEAERQKTPYASAGQWVPGTAVAALAKRVMSRPKSAS